MNNIIFENKVFSTLVFTLKPASMVKHIVEVKDEPAFKVLNITGSLTGVVPTKFSLQIKDSRCRKEWFSSPVLFANIVGNSNRPFYLTVPKILGNLDTFELTFWNYDAISTATVQLVFNGTEI